MSKKMEYLMKNVGVLKDLSLIILAIIWNKMSDLSDEDMNELLDKLNYTYNKKTKIVSNGDKSYTIFELYKSIIEDEYPRLEILDKKTMGYVCQFSFEDELISEEEKNRLQELL